MMTKLCFFDDYYITARPGTKRMHFYPQKVGEFNDNNASLQLYTSFFYDTKSNKYRLYYEVPISGTEVRKIMMATANCIYDFVNGNVETIAVSGLDDKHGMHGCSVTYDSKNDRYVLLGNAYADDKSKRYFCKAFSDDGMVFSGVTPVYSDSGNDYKDTYNSLYYNKFTDEFYATTRCATMDRRVALIRSKDCINWTKPQLILHPPANENIGTQYYALGVNYIDGLYYGILWRFITDLNNPDFSDMGGYMENDLLYSYDGQCFTVTGLAPFCNRPSPPEYGSKQLWLLNMVEHNDEYIICGGGTNIAHGSSYGDEKFATTVFYSIRKDGFCALYGENEGGIIYTKPFLFEGDDIILNYDAKEGEISIEITDQHGNPFKNFNHSNCLSFKNNQQTNGKLRYINSDLNELIGKKIRFKIQLNNAMLFSMRFNGKPFIHNVPQISVNLPFQEDNYDNI